MNDDALSPGTSLQNGAFVLAEQIGRGGSGFTYRARDVALQRDVAIKEFFPPGSARDGVRVRSSDIEYSKSRADFLEEARNLARFAHPNIVHVFGVWEENGTAYLVMELLRGTSLRELVETRGALPQDEALNLLAPVCDAVETVHRAGLLHGDIKPDNVVMGDDGRVVLLDFGLTRPAPSGSYHTTLLVPQSAQGTAGYAPLEQYSRVARTGIWSDVYALAATLWHLLSGEAPPDAPDRASGTALPDLRGINATVSAQTEHALHAALSMDILARPQSAREFWNALQPQHAAGAELSVGAPTSSTRYSPRIATPRPPVHDENTVAMLIVMSIALFVVFFLVMSQHF